MSSSSDVATEQQLQLDGIQALCFSNRPIAVNETVTIRFVSISTTNTWSGGLRFGVTAHDPEALASDLPQFACPGLTSKPGTWAYPLSEAHCRQGSVLQFWVTANGWMLYKIDGQDKGPFLARIQLDKPLFAVLDVYGSTLELEFVDKLDHPDLGTTNHGESIESMQPLSCDSQSGTTGALADVPQHDNCTPDPLPSSQLDPRLATVPRPEASSVGPTAASSRQTATSSGTWLPLSRPASAGEVGVSSPPAAILRDSPPALAEKERSSELSVRADAGVEISSIDSIHVTQSADISFSRSSGLMSAVDVSCCDTARSLTTSNCAPSSTRATSKRRSVAVKPVESSPASSGPASAGNTADARPAKKSRWESSPAQNLESVQTLRAVNASVEETPAAGHVKGSSESSSANASPSVNTSANSQSSSAITTTTIAVGHVSSSSQSSPVKPIPPNSLVTAGGQSASAQVTTECSRVTASRQSSSSAEATPATTHATSHSQPTSANAAPEISQVAASSQSSSTESANRVTIGTASSLLVQENHAAPTSQPSQAAVVGAPVSPVRPSAAVPPWCRSPGNQQAERPPQYVHPPLPRKVAPPPRQTGQPAVQWFRHSDRGQHRASGRGSHLHSPSHFDPHGPRGPRFVGDGRFQGGPPNHPDNHGYRPRGSRPLLGAPSWRPWRY